MGTVEVWKCIWNCMYPCLSFTDYFMHVSDHSTCSLHLMFQTMLPLRLHEFQSQTSAYWVSYKTFKSLTLALVGRDNTGCACIIAPVHGICLHYITQRCYYAIQSIQPSTDRTHTYIHVYIYYCWTPSYGTSIWSNIRRCPYRTCTCTQCTFTHTQTLYCYIYEHVLQWQVIKWTTLCRKQSAI